MCLNHPETIPHPAPPPGLWKSCLPRNWSLVPKRLGTAALDHSAISLSSKRKLENPHVLGN